MDPTSLTGRRWRLVEADGTAVKALAKRLSLPDLAARCLLNRTTPELAGAWLQPSMEHLHDPMLMLGMDVALDRISRALRDREHVRIVTDYDVDGTTSSLILQRTLQILSPGAKIDYHIPHRFDEGYGFSQRAAEAAAADGVRLILTADIGVRDHVAVNTAVNAGVSVIVCDHHLPSGEAVPEAATAVLCPPQAGCPYPNKALAACGVSLKLASALLAKHPKRDAVILSMLKMAAIGTVADVVDLSTLENRAIVSLGIDAMRAGPNAPGLTALLEVAGLTTGEISSTDLGFRLGPRINAAGRLAEATAVVKLFEERDLEAARRRAAELDRLNRERQSIQEQLLKAALSRLSDPAPAFVVLSGDEADGWHRGIVGIVAAKVRERVHRPVAVVAIAGEEGRGSVRSVPEVHAVLALESAADLLVKFGGHPVAAGFTVRTANLPALAERLAEYVSTHAGDEALIPALDLDAEVSARTIDRDAVEALARLGPYGKGNSAPMVAIEAGPPERVGLLGDRHLRFEIRGLEMVWWGGAAQRGQLVGPVRVAGTPGMNTWKGRSTVRLTVEDVARPTPPRA